VGAGVGVGTGEGAGAGAGEVLAVVLALGEGGSRRFQVSEPTTPSASSPIDC
jgi:hypothetical protein